MDGSPRRCNEKHPSARRLFSNIPGQERSSTSSRSSRRKLVLVPETDDPKPNVVARLMGLDSLPEMEQPQPQTDPIKSQQQQQVRLQELLKIKEPLLLKELLRESEDQPNITSIPRKVSLMQKFTGFVKRRPDERTRKLVLSPVKSPRNLLNMSSSSKVSPIKSPIKSKRGLLLEAAVKFLDVEDEPEQQQQQQRKQDFVKRKFSLSRSSSEPCLSSVSTSAPKVSSGIKKLSENVGKEFTKRFGGSSKPAAGNSKAQTKGNRNLVRSKSDLGLEKSKREVGGFGLFHHHHHHHHHHHQQQQQQQQEHRAKLDHPHKQSLSQPGKNPSSSSSSSNKILKLFGNHRGKDKPGHAKPPTSSTNTTRPSSEPSSLVRSLLLRRKSTSNKPPRQRPAHHVKNLPPEQGSSDDLTTTSTSFSDEFSDDSTEQSRSDGSGSPSSSTSTRLEKSGQPSPVSVLEAAFVDDHTTNSSCSSIEDSPEARSTAALVSPSAPASSDSIINAILDISRIRCIDLSDLGFNPPCRERVEESSGWYVEEVLTTSRCLWSEQHQSTGSPSENWYSEGLPISQESFDIVESRLSGRAEVGSFQARRLMFDCVDEAVAARIRWRRVSRAEEAARAVQEQIEQWRSMSGNTTDELVEKDMSVGDGKWRQREQQVDEIARDLESSILRKMIEEVVRELT